MSTSIVPLNVDTYNEEPTPNRNNGDAARLHLRGGTTHRRFAYLYAAPPFPLGASVLSATLVVYLAEAWASSQNLIAKRITEDWKESRLDFSNRPAVSASNAGTTAVASLADGDRVEIELDDLFVDVSGGADYHGLRLEIDQDVLRKIYSSDNPVDDLRPMLEIEWSQAPNPPIIQTPSGNRQVSVAKPTLVWQFSDNLGDTSQSASQVQIATEPTFASPSYDSTKTANTLPYWDLAATAFGGLSDGDDRYWRVKVWDGADLESDWSDAAAFGRTTKDSLTLTNPPASPSNVVEETTPPIIHSFGGTQTAVERQLTRVSDSPPTLLWHDARHASTATSEQVPSGNLRTGDTYEVMVRVWDDVDRAVTPGDPDYVEVRREFTYVRSGDPTAPSSLTATPAGAAVELEIERASAPDFFALRVDGVEVEDRIDPGEIFVSGTTYLFKWWKAIPRQAYTYEIEAVVEDTGVLEHSGPNPSDEATTSPVGVWLVDPDDGLAVFIAGKEKASMGIGEDAETITLLGERSPVRITEQVRGYEGSWQGVVQTGAERDDFLTLKGRLGEVRLIIGDLNIPVVLEAVSAIPDKDADAGYLVAFSYFQSDEFTFEVVGG